MVIRSLLVLPLLFTLTTACKSKVPITSTASYIIGDSNDIKPIDSKTKEKLPPAHLNAAVLLTVNVDEARRKFCSGTLIPPATPEANPRVITNHHCFSADSPDGAVPETTFSEPCQRITVFFGFYRDEIESRKLGQCQKGSFRNDYEGDLAVFTLQEPPPAPAAPAQFWEQGEVPVGRTARIIHYPSIDEEGAAGNLVFEKSVGIALPVAQVTEDNCVALGRFAQEEWSLDKALGMGIKHTCDQKKGSSGSALFDAETNTILGINWGGISLSYANPTRTEIYNVATRVKYVKAFLDGNLDEEKATIALGRDIPNSDGKVRSTGRSAKNALGSCGTIGVGTSNKWHLLTLFMLLFPVAFTFRQQPRQPNQ